MTVFVKAEYTVKRCPDCYMLSRWYDNRCQHCLMLRRERSRTSIIVITCIVVFVIVIIKIWSNQA